MGARQAPSGELESVQQVAGLGGGRTEKAEAMHESLVMDGEGGGKGGGRRERETERGGSERKTPQAINPHRPRLLLHSISWRSPAR